MEPFPKTCVTQCNVSGISVDGVCHVMKIAVAEGDSDTGLLTQHTFCLGPNVLARNRKMPIMTETTRCQ